MEVADDTSLETMRKKRLFEWVLTPHQHIQGSRIMPTITTNWPLDPISVLTIHIHKSLILASNPSSALGSVISIRNQIVKAYAREDIR
ncbi:10415_t:CDS:2 [Paraglomus brasilianum]|uniref:10415_t:CDS:1 n=1 Tax=Paraglomus brasilianum TaxID=144538 RepID=A0A9N8ZMJ2_9GLOM|nr:10415_t:CDS:2 [Paraglomus brasilianum]